MNITLEVIAINSDSIWMSDITDSSSDTMDTAMCGLWRCNDDDSIWGAIRGVIVLYASLGHEPVKTALDEFHGRKAYEPPMAVADAVFDLVSMLETPENPQCVGDEMDCPCYGCQLATRIYDAIDDIRRRTHPLE